MTVDYVETFGDPPFMKSSSRPVDRRLLVPLLYFTLMFTECSVRLYPAGPPGLVEVCYY